VKFMVDSTQSRPVGVKQETNNFPMKSSLVILYHREPYDEVKENGKTVYREKKSPNGIVPTLKSFFANAESSTWVAWKQVTAKQQETLKIG
jgi:glucosylglycerol-phosphate synthase